MSFQFSLLDLITIISGIAGVIFGASAIFSTREEKKSGEINKNATLATDISYIKAGIESVVKDIKELKEQNQDLAKKYAIIEYRVDEHERTLKEICKSTISPDAINNSSDK